MLKNTYTAPPHLTYSCPGLPGSTPHPGSVLYGPLKVLQQYTVIECKHKGAMSATKCLLYHCRNATELNNYIAGTQVNVSVS